MKRTINPLLAAIRMHPSLCPTCQRVYTTVRKDGVHRVKFYNVSWQFANTTLPLYSALKHLGWSKVSVQAIASPFGYRIESLQILAKK